MRSVVALLVAACVACGGERVPLGETGGTAGNAGASGSGGSGGSAGSGGAGATSDKLDLLFVVDNSVSMADKQALLSTAVDELLLRIVNPRCVDPSGKAIAQPKAPLDPCPSGSQRELSPVRDLHVGVISSSLGAHGGDVCDAATAPAGSTTNDRAHLMGSIRTGLNSFDGNGFLAWDPDGRYGGETDAAGLVQNVVTHILAAGENGCGFEAPLEAMYRFLVDPEPWQSVSKSNGENQLVGTDQVVLAQRAAFLRPDSTVAVVLLSDENDCSIRDFGTGIHSQSWLVSSVGSGGVGLPRATTICKTDPNDKCCRSCGQADVAGCAPAGSDAECVKGNYSGAEDHMNLRCWDQKRRFGVDWLYPVERYIDGLSKATVQNRAEAEVANPLFAGGRDPNLVIVSAIVGVPWQDVATSSSLAPGAPLQLATATELKARFDWMLPSGGTAPTDAFMLEAFEVRAGKNPATGEATAPPSAGPLASSINGHERDLVAAGGASGPNDLQYACIFPLAPPRDCAGSSLGCDCTQVDPGDYSENSPLCQHPSTGTYGTVQHFAKAYPSPRQLSVLRGLGESAVFGSVCPKTLEGSVRDPGFGYNPVFTSLIGKLTTRLR